MRANRSIVVIGTVLTLLVATVGIAAAVTAGEQSEAPSEQIQVAGSADVSAEPDQAILRLGVEATAEDAETARDTVAENATALRSTLADLGIDGDQIETDYYRVDEERDRSDREGQRDYRVDHGFEITVEDTDRVGDVIDGAIDNGANTVRGVSFTLSAEKRHELRQDALEAAMDRARTDAETLASSADLTVVGAASISASDVSVRPYQVERAMMDAEGETTAETTVESGPVDVSASVQVVYNATGP